jgi:hypothetical protein
MTRVRVVGLNIVEVLIPIAKASQALWAFFQALLDAIYNY